MTQLDVGMRSSPGAAAGASVAEILRLAVQGSPTGVTVVDAQGAVVVTNTPAREMGVVDGSTVHPGVWELAQRVLADHAVHRVELAEDEKYPRGRITSVCAVAKPLSLCDERFVAIFSTDESESQRMEFARRDFVANVSHELKTPVGGMALLAEVVVESAEDPEAVRHFGSKLLNEAHRMSSLINELISLSKLQGAEKMPDMKPVSVDVIIDEALRRNAVAAENATITVDRDEPRGLKVMGDLTLLVTALTNLVVNAINYSPAATPVSVTHRATRREDGTEAVVIDVTDHGIGISPEDQSRVFERFFRVDKARSRQTGGTGLGLAIVKHVAANHGGAIRLRSVLGEGSTFSLELPAPAVADATSDVGGAV